MSIKTPILSTNNLNQCGKYIGIDACNAYTGKVNCIVIEDDEDDEIFV